MTAANDYPALIDLAEESTSPSVTGEIRKALDEIDLLRTARDDYPDLAHFGEEGEHGGLDHPHTTTEARRALDEIDFLRAAAKYGSASRSQDERRP